MFSFLKKEKKNPGHVLQCDLHSHLLPGIDDGVDTLGQSLEIAVKFQELGYEKLITTPHIMQGFFDNTPEIIRGKLSETRAFYQQNNCSIGLEAAAEYYLDEYLVDLIDSKSELLTFGNNYILFETGFMNEPVNLKEVIFKLKSNGYNPILAHPERYAYLGGRLDLIEDLIDRGVYMQLNMNSIIGYYSPEIKKMAKKMIDAKMIHFLGSDCHNYRHMAVLEDTISKKYMAKALDLDLLNHTL